MGYFEDLYEGFCGEGQACVERLREGGDSWEDSVSE